MAGDTTSSLLTVLVVDPEVVPPGVVAPGRHGSASAPVGADRLQGP